MISQTAEYALRAVVYLANQQGTAKTTAQISEATHVPAGYLAKVMLGLSRAKLVHSQRGLNGGFTLGDSPENLTILAIVDAVDPIRRYPACPLGLKEHGEHLCPLHQRLDDAGEMVEKAFAGTTVAELATTPRGKKTFCRFPNKGRSKS